MTQHGLALNMPVEDGAFSSDGGAQQESNEKLLEPPLPTKRIAKLLKKTRVCKHYQRGHCRFENQCSYAHQADELMPKPDLTKTKLCAHFLAGCCKIENCSYAHGSEEVTKTRAMALHRAQASYNASFAAPHVPGIIKRDPYPLDGEPARIEGGPQKTGWSPPVKPYDSPVSVRGDLSSLRQALQEPMFQQQPAKWHGGRAQVRNSPTLQHHQPQLRKQKYNSASSAGSHDSNGNTSQFGLTAMGWQHIAPRGAMQAQAWQFDYPAELNYGVPNSNLRSGINYHFCDGNRGRSDGKSQTASTTSSDGPQQFPVLDDIIAQNGNKFNYQFKDDNVIRNNDAIKYIDDAQLDLLVSQKHENLMRWHDLVTDMMERNTSSKRWLYKWLRDCEHAKHLPPMIEDKIASLFVRDPSWAAIFPRLWRHSEALQCPETPEDPAEGFVYSL